MKNHFKLINHGIALLCPPACPACNSSASSHALSLLCSGCKPPLSYQPRCKNCGRILTKTIVHSIPNCRYCRNITYKFDSLFCVAAYHQSWKRIILKMKTDPRMHLKLQLAHMLAAIIKRNKELQKFQLLVTVPDRPGKNLHTIKSITKQTANLLGREYNAALKFNRKTIQQHNLGRIERFKNMDKSLTAASQAVHSKDIIVIDDVFTTGATMNECARALKKAGAAKVHGLTLARGLTKYDE